MKEIKLQVEELEERIAPSFVLTGTPDDNADPMGPRGDGTFGPSSGTNGPNAEISTENEGAGASNAKAPWSAHDNSGVLENGGT